MIDTKKKLLFVHIPKTAGTSITYALGGEKSDRCHATLRHHTKCPVGSVFGSLRPSRVELSLKIFVQSRFVQKLPIIDSDYRVFTVVRNPWARAVSWYRDVMRYEPHQVGNKIPAGINFRDFLLNYSHFWGMRPQMHWLLDWNGKVGIDPQLILRQEALSSEWERLCDIMKIDCKLPISNAAPVAEDWRDYYTDELIEYVYENYTAEIELFEYQF